MPLHNFSFPPPLFLVSFIPGVVIDKTLYAWLAVFVLPVNSALNPILYTLATKIFKQQVLAGSCGALACLPLKAVPDVL